MYTYYMCTYYIDAILFAFFQTRTCFVKNHWLRWSESAWWAHDYHLVWCRSVGQSFSAKSPVQRWMEGFDGNFETCKTRNQGSLIFHGIFDGSCSSSFCRSTKALFCCWFSFALFSTPRFTPATPCTCQIGVKDTETPQIVSSKPEGVRKIALRDPQDSPWFLAEEKMDHALKVHLHRQGWETKHNGYDDTSFTRPKNTRICCVCYTYCPWISRAHHQNHISPNIVVNPWGFYGNSSSHRVLWSVAVWKSREWSSFFCSCKKSRHRGQWWLVLVSWSWVGERSKYQNRKCRQYTTIRNLDSNIVKKASTCISTLSKGM